MRTVVLGRAVVQLLDIDGVLESAVLDKGTLGDLLIVLCQAHDET